MGMPANAVDSLFGSDGPLAGWALGSVAFRAIALYVYGLLLIRFGKSRLMGNATALDVVVVIVLGSLLSRGINGSASFSSTVVASAILVTCHWLSTWATARFHALGGFFKGHARVLVADGQVDDEALRRSHISRDDLHEGMRLTGNVDDPALVHRAYKERSGQISVVRRAPQARVVEFSVEDGVKVVRLELGGN